MKDSTQIMVKGTYNHKHEDALFISLLGVNREVKQGLNGAPLADILAASQEIVDELKAKTDTIAAALDIFEGMRKP